MCKNIPAPFRQKTAHDNLFASFAMIATGVFLFAFCCLSPAFADKEKLLQSYDAAVASAHPLATQAGIDILEHGGNAFDAAIAVSATLAVVEPYSSGIGGGGFWLLHDAARDKNIMLDGRERAPLAARRDMYLDKQGEVIQGASVTGPLSAGIPGVPAALDHMARKYGQLPLSVTLAPAIKLAREGFPVDAYYQRMASFRLQEMQRYTMTRAVFLSGGEIPEVGTLIRQPDLADTLKTLAEQGRKGFYEGSVAWEIVRAVRRAGGIWTMKDLATYEVVERTPVTEFYKGIKLVTATLPSSGGLVLSEMLNILSAYDVDSLDEVQRTHLLVEVMRRAYRDRAKFMGDTDFVDVPADMLLSEQYTRGLIKSIDIKQATESAALGAVALPGGDGTDTTHFSIVDQQGNRVSATLSINYPFGSCFVAGSSGVLLNDEMDDFP